jgi:hypothetical protein
MENKVEVDYKQLVAEAEKAVAGVQDPELRRAAFEKILERLLGNVASETAPKQKTQEPRKKIRNKGGPTTYIEELIGDGFFKQQRSLPQVKAELANRGHHVPQTSLSGPLQKLCQAKKLRRERQKADDDRTTYCYSEW